MLETKVTTYISSIEVIALRDRISESQECVISYDKETQEIKIDFGKHNSGSDTTIILAPEAAPKVIDKNNIKINAGSK